MTWGDYLSEVLRTATPASRNIINCALGLCGEAGEFADLVKKATFQGHELNREDAKEELGDIAWYLTLAVHCMGLTMDEVMEGNRLKLRGRYPDGFTPERSRGRKEYEIGKTDELTDAVMRTVCRR